MVTHSLSLSLLLSLSSLSPPLSLSFFLSLSYFLLYLFQQPGDTLISLYKIRTDEKSTSGHLQISTQWEDYKRKGEITIKMMNIEKKNKKKKQLFNTQNVHRKTNITPGFL